MTTYSAIEYDTDDRVAIITFNRPKQLNAFSLELCHEVMDAIGQADRDPGYSCADRHWSRRQSLLRRL